jgi:hypothetical protein
LLSRLKNNPRLVQQKYASVWILPLTIGLFILSVNVANWTNSELPFTIGSYGMLIGAAAFGILVPKKRDNFYCPKCHTLLGWRVFLQTGSEFRRQMKQKWPSYRNAEGELICCPACIPLDEFKKHELVDSTIGIGDEETLAEALGEN